MLPEINLANITALAFLLAGAGYLYICAITFFTTAKSKQRRDYFSVGICLALFSIFYGLMTVASDETLIRIFWACGFIPSYIFPVRWIQFVSNMVTFKRDRLIKITINIALVIAVVISLLCVLYGDTVFVQTQFGNQFSYQNSLIFKVACAYTTLMIIAFMILHIKWWRDSETKRQKV